MDVTPPNPRRLRFSAAQHLRRATEFKRVYREGNRARGDLMTVAAVANQLGYSRLGLSVGKVVWKSAVRRNRVRRLFREAFRLEFEAIPAGYDIVLIGQKAARPELSATREELLRLSHKAARRYREKVEQSTRADEPSGEAKREPS